MQINIKRYPGISYEKACARVAKCRALIAEFSTAGIEKRCAIRRALERLVPCGVYRTHEPGKEDLYFHVAGIRRIGPDFAVLIRRITAAGTAVSEWRVLPLFGQGGFLAPAQIRHYEGHAYELIGEMEHVA